MWVPAGGIVPRQVKVAMFLLSSKDTPQKMQVLGYNKKAGKSVSWNAKWREIFKESTVTKICLSPNFLGYSSSP